MPELPDVELFKVFVEAHVPRRPIQAVRMASLLKDVTPAEFRRRLKGESFEESRRHGKYLGIRLSGGSWVVFHFGMTGRFATFDKGEEPPQYSRMILDFEAGASLAFVCPRKFGRIRLVPDFCAFVRERKLGPDALAILLPDFRRRIGQRRGGAKSILMNQETLAGLGNLYVDETLFQARIHPAERVEGLDAAALTVLYRQMGKVLRTALKVNARPGNLPRTYLSPHRHAGGHCPRCSGGLRRETHAGRTTYYCPACQQLKKRR